MKKTFKTKKDKEYIANIYTIIKNNNKEFSDKDIIKLCLEISKSGCTYASMANAIMDQMSNNIEYLEEKLGYSISNKDGVMEYDRLMIDIFSAISNMIELEYYKNNVYKFSTIKECYENIVNKPHENEITSINELNSMGIMMDGFSEDGLLMFKDVKNINKQVLIGTYKELANNLFGINQNINKEQLETLLKDNGYNYKINNDIHYSKFSGLGRVKEININKWLNTFFRKKNIDIEIDVENINDYGKNYEEFITIMNDKIKNNYSVLVSSNKDSEVWMTDGKSWEKPSYEAGHRMNFNGFDNEGNILLCSWGKNYIVPKEYFNRLEFTSVKLSEPLNTKMR